DLDALHGGNGHDGRADPAVELAVPGHVRAESGRQPVGDDFGDAAEGVASALDLVDVGDHALLGRGVEGAQRRGVGRGVEVLGHGIRPHGIDAAEVDDVAAYADAELHEKTLADRRGGDTGRGLARRGAFENVARVVTVVLEDAREVRVAGTDAGDGAWAQGRGERGGGRGEMRGRTPLFLHVLSGGHDLLPVLPVAVPDQHGDRGTERLAGPNAGEELDGVLLDLHAASAAVALLPARELGVDVSGGEWKAGRHAFENAHECRAVGFAGGGETNHSLSVAAWS